MVMEIGWGNSVEQASRSITPSPTKHRVHELQMEVESEGGTERRGAMQWHNEDEMMS